MAWTLQLRAEHGTCRSFQLNRLNINRNAISLSKHNWFGWIFVFFFCGFVYLNLSFQLLLISNRDKWIISIWNDSTETKNFFLECKDGNREKPMHLTRMFIFNAGRLSCVIINRIYLHLTGMHSEFQSISAHRPFSVFILIISSSLLLFHSPILFSLMTFHALSQLSSNCISFLESIISGSEILLEWLFAIDPQLWQKPLKSTGARMPHINNNSYKFRHVIYCT